MKTIFVLLTMLVLLFSSFVTKSEECISLVNIIIDSREDGGIIVPLTPDNIRVLVDTESLPSEILDYKGDFYLEHRNFPVVRIFNVKDDCADYEWFMPTYRVQLLKLKSI